MKLCIESMVTQTQTQRMDSKQLDANGAKHVTLVKGSNLFSAFAFASPMSKLMLKLMLTQTQRLHVKKILNLKQFSLRNIHVIVIDMGTYGNATQIRNSV